MTKECLSRDNTQAISASVNAFAIGVLMGLGIRF